MKSHSGAIVISNEIMSAPIQLLEILTDNTEENRLPHSTKAHLFSPLSNQDYKGFLRFRIDAAGDLHGYMMGCDMVPRHWRLNPDGAFPIWREDDRKKKSKWCVRDSFTLER